MKRGGLVFIAGGFLRSIAKSVNILGGFEFSQLDAAGSGSALTYQRARHSLPSPFESPLPKRKEHLWCSFLFGLPWGIRTPNRQNRNLILYPIALRADEIPCGILSFF